jgi:nucleotide sugar dehydrogenase
MEIRNLRIGVVGLGCVGLGLAVEFSKISIVNGYDNNKKRILDLKKGKDVNFLFKKKELIKSSINFSNSLKELKNCNFYIICVPTPVTKKKIPDLRFLKQSSKQIGKLLKKKDIVVYESTVYPGCTEEVCIPILEKYSNLKINKNFYCGYSPERINPGDKINKLNSITKLVSGSSRKSTKIIKKIYSKIIKAGIHVTKNIKTAEASKVLENTQRSVNISLINEVSVLFNKLNINTKDVLDAANTKWNFSHYTPGLVGGHCIAVDPYYLVYKAKALGLKTNLITGSQKINEEMPKIISERFLKVLKKKINKRKKRVLIMGLTFKENYSDIRESKVFDIVNYLIKRNIEIKTYDPWVLEEELPKNLKNFHIKNTKNLSNFDGIIIAVCHNKFKKLGLKKILSFCNKKRVIFDVKNLFKSKLIDEIL